MFTGFPNHSPSTNYVTMDNFIVNGRISYLSKAREKTHTSNFALLLDLSKTLHLSTDQAKAITRLFKPNKNKENAKTNQTNPEVN